MSRRKAAADKQEPRSLKTKQWMDVRTVVRRQTSEVRKKENAKSEDPTRLTTVVWLTAGTHDSRQAKAKRAVHSKTTRVKRGKEAKPKALVEHKKRANQTIK